MKSEKNVIVIGMDGLSPDIMDRMMADGDLPNFSRLADEGTYSRLGTTNPPQSPVVWSSFATGLPPAGHGIFDFVRRDPKTYGLSLATASESFKESARKGTAFWTTLSEAGIPTSILFCPVTFPPEKVNGVMVSGMGVPDLRGTPGTYFYYTTRKEESGPKGEKENTGAGLVFHVSAKDGIIDAEIPGLLTKDGAEISVPFHVTLSPQESKATITIQGQTIELKKDEWSDWVKLSFKQSAFRHIAGIARFYLRELAPEFSLYVSPVEFNPANPPFAVSYPKNYSKELCSKIGLFHTRGMPYDTKALEAGILDEDAFLAQAGNVLAEKEAILNHELSRFKGGLLFFYFEYPDPIQHMFWRFEDREHPSYTEEGARQHGDVIEDCYRKMDRILGDVIARMPTDATLLVLSDHGFASFRKAINLNTWLAREGFLSLKEGCETGRELFADVDWKTTRAYACGFNAMYLNRKGREGQGILTAEAAEALAKAIKTKLEKLTDPETGDRVVQTVHVVENTPDGPDLIIGYRPPYRASWRTALGAVPKELIELNKKKWSGDHCMDATCVPGVFFANTQLGRVPGRVTDIAGTILELADLQKRPKKSRCISNP